VLAFVNLLYVGVYEYVCAFILQASALPTIHAPIQDYELGRLNKGVTLHEGKE